MLLALHITIGNKGQHYDALTVDECLKAIQDDPWFQP
jgi:hypothetical protein